MFQPFLSIFSDYNSIRSLGILAFVVNSIKNQKVQFEFIYNSEVSTKLFTTVF